jgi:hypothetical protein
MNVAGNAMAATAEPAAFLALSVAAYFYWRAFSSFLIGAGCFP